MPKSKSPVSEKQLAANRANAARSTGPRTPEGKTRSAQNARKHGFTASTFAVVRLEDLQELEHLKADLTSVYQPINPQELFAVERIALAQQSLLRAARLESGLLTFCLEQAMDDREQPFTPMPEALTNDIEITRQQNRNYCLSQGFHRMASSANTFGLFLRSGAGRTPLPPRRRGIRTPPSPAPNPPRSAPGQSAKRTHFHCRTRTQYAEKSRRP